MKVCCVIGHRKIEETQELIDNTKRIIRELIEEDKVTTFLFGSKSQFTNLCYDIITDFVENGAYYGLSRIKVRAEYPIISKDYYEYLKTFYEETYYYDEKLLSNKWSYIKRDRYLIDNSDISLFYYDDNYTPIDKITNNKTYFPIKKKVSGTQLAYEYAIKKNKKIINLFNE